MTRELILLVCTKETWGNYSDKKAEKEAMKKSNDEFCYL